jgi:hypothetical protein
LYLVIVPGIPVLAFVVWLKWFVARTEERYRRPFDDMPRPAGWSLQNRTIDLMDQVLINMMGGIMVGVISFVAAPSAKGNSTVMLIAGFAACSFMLFRSARLLIRARNHRLGFLGEQVVGQILDRLSSDSIRIFHDLEVREPGRKPWNIDHVAVTPAGVFAIETKTRRKPRGDAPDGQQGHKVIFDGQQLRFPAPMSADRHGLDQTQRNADWLSGKLTALNGCAIHVTPVLVLPGWWVEAKSKGPVNVLNPKGLRSFLNGRAPILAAERQSAIAAQLEERCRIDLSKPA